MLRKTIKYLREVRLELKKVRWPTKPQIVRLTLVVLIVMVALGAYIGGVDLVLTKILQIGMRQ